jgi:hypothetical protein
MGYAIKIPLIHGKDVVRASEIGQVAQHLDEEDAAVFTELALDLAIKSGSGLISLSGIAEGLEAGTPAQRKRLLDKLRRRAGLPSIAELEEQRSIDVAKNIRPIDRPVRLGIAPSGAIIDLNARDDETVRQQQLARELAARREAQAQVRAIEAQDADEHRRARDARHHAELPTHLK